LTGITFPESKSASMSKAYRTPVEVRADFHLTEKMPWVVIDPRIDRLAQYAADLEVALDLAKRTTERLRLTLQEAQQAEVEAIRALESARVKAAVGVNLFQSVLTWDAARGGRHEKQAMADLREAITMWRREEARL